MSADTSMATPRRIRRFSTYRIVEHLLLILLFATLALTGLPQKFHQVGICQSLILLIGGIDMARIIHHWAGVLFLLLAVEHIAVNFIGIVFRQWDPSLLIRGKLKDAFIRSIMGLLPKPALCGASATSKNVLWLVLIGGSR